MVVSVLLQLVEKMKMRQLKKHGEGACREGRFARAQPGGGGGGCGGGRWGWLHLWASCQYTISHVCSGGAGCPCNCAGLQTVKRLPALSWCLHCCCPCQEFLMPGVSFCWPSQLPHTLVSLWAPATLPRPAVWIGALGGVAISVVIGIVFIILFYVANSKIFSGHAQASRQGWDIVD